MRTALIAAFAAIGLPIKEAATGKKQRQRGEIHPLLIGMNQRTEFIHPNYFRDNGVSAKARMMSTLGQYKTRKKIVH